MSDWEMQHFSIETLVEDLSVVVEVLELDAFSVAGVCSGWPAEIALAVRYPEKVTRLVLHGSFGIKPYKS